MEEALGYYDSIQQMMDSMPCELELKTFTRNSSPCYLLQSKNNDELQRHLPDTSIPVTRISTEVTNQDFSFLVSDLYTSIYLVQIWAPVTIGAKKYLTTSDQPFAVEVLDRGLCSYRKHCLDYLIPVDDDMSSTERGLLGPPGRVFRNEFPEVCLEVSHYTSIEYPMRDKAVACEIHSYLALPLSKSSEYKCGSVVELVVYSGDMFGLWTVRKRLLDGNPEFIAECPSPKNFNINKMLEPICKTHHLLLAQTWFFMPYSSGYNNEAIWKDERSSYIYLDSDYEEERGEDYYDLVRFTEASYYIMKGQGVVGKAYSSKGACFCKDITQLSIDEYSMLPNARLASLTGCFAISLVHRYRWRDYIFIVELFLPHKETQNGDPRTFIKNLVATMKEHLKDFRVASGQELGENLFVEVLKTSITDELDSFEICAGTDNTLSGAQAAFDLVIGANVFPDSRNLN